MINKVRRGITYVLLYLAFLLVDLACWVIPKEQS
jgi:hypothetical protein